MKISRRIAALRRQVKQLAATAERRAVQAEATRTKGASFRLLSEGEAEAIVGDKLLATLSRPRLWHQRRACLS